MAPKRSSAIGGRFVDAIRKYADGGEVDQYADEEGDDEDYDDYEEDEPTKVVYQTPEQQESSTDTNSWEEGKEDPSMVFVANRPDYDGRVLTKADEAEDNAAWDRNTSAAMNIASQTGSYIGEYIDDDLMDLVMGDPKKYVEVRSNPEAYDKFKKAYQKAWDERGGPEVGMDVKPVYDMIYDPKFWQSIKTQSFQDKNTYRTLAERLGFIDQIEYSDEELAEQAKARELQKANQQVQANKLIEMIDERGVTHLTDNPNKILRRHPTARVKLGDVNVKKRMPKAIQVGPVR